ncbi:hypothetical protein Poly30_12310 [Planctomycetes bacterium Poly30]|uniref:Uncharacterized protein n=1 Tax=Saltatorellus ferox TaxID=2528018 RepID=A0A518ENS2_9BACT|nr:hypothetical protein Poly30_12310 [Planctomycetes bacterium Poly30]
MKLTLFGVRSLVFYATVVVAYVSAPYVNLFFLLLAFLTLHWILAFAWTSSSLRGLTAQVDELPAVVANTPARVAVRFHAERGRLFDVNATLLVQFPGQKRPLRASGGVAVLSGRAQSSLAVPALPRGVYPVFRAEVWSSYPFGLMKRILTLADAPTEVVVFPQPTSVTDASGGRTAEDFVRDMLGSNVSGDGDMQPSGLRDRREGDSLRSIHWRASARRGKLVVLEWEGGGGEGLEVVLDRRCSAAELEEALSDLSALVQFAREGKEVLAIRSQDLNMTFGEGHEPFDRALYFLASAQVIPMDGAAPPAVSPTVLRLPRRSLSA